MKTLVIAEHNNQKLLPATLKLVAAALQIHSTIDLIIIGNNCSDVTKQAKTISGIETVIVADNESYKDQITENIASVILSIADDYQCFMAAASTMGKTTMPYLAAKLDVTQISEVIEIESEDTFFRPIYAGNAIAKIKSLDKKKVLTVRTTMFEAVELKGSANVRELSDVFTSEKTTHLKDALSQSERPELNVAPMVISGGRGLQSKENFNLLSSIADKLGGAVGASRAAVDAGYAANDLQVGQTGKIVAPDLYIAVGISGAIQHLAGMKESKVIVAINKDPDAPIFQVADYGLVADLFDVLPEIEAKL